MKERINMNGAATTVKIYTVQNMRLRVLHPEVPLIAQSSTVSTERVNNAFFSKL